MSFLSKSIGNTALIFLIIFLLQGCGMFDSDIVKDMDKAYSDCKKNMTNGQEVSCKEKMSLTVEKYFPVGMPLSEALEHFHSNGFQIMEYRQEGFREWPNEKIRPYPDAGFKKGAITEDYIVVYATSKIYRNYLIANKEVVIGIYSLDGESISSAKGSININSI